MDRTQLFDSLSNLPPAAFERLLIAVNMPRMNRAGDSAKIGDQVSALLEWAESNLGPGVEAIASHLTELNRFEFDAYLRSLMDTYEKWWTHYTLTDATGKVEQPKPEQPSVFDFGFDFRLMVQTVAKEKDAPSPELRSEEREKTERLPVLDGIRKYADDHVLLVGRPGSGKSTALIKLVLDLADQTLKDGQGQMPILVELRYWQTSVIERIQAFLNRHDPSLSLDDAALNALLRQGRFLLLIDGLNELPSDEARNQLNTFRRDHPKVPMIFTTRDLGLGGDLGIEKKLEMQPLTEAQMKEFIRAYVPDQAEAMLRQLNNRLREFGQTPLLLWMLCEVFQQSPNRQMPTNLAEVFRAFTTMYEDSSVRKHEVALLKGDVRPLSDRRLWKEALKALAALMMQGETPVDFRVAIHRTEAERELGKLFANEKFPARDILDDLLKYHLLQNRTTDQLEFRHQLIQEYYAAEHLLDLFPELSDEQLKRDYLNLLKWTEAIALMLALVNDAAQALRVVKLAMNDVDLILGARLAGEIKPTDQIQALGYLNSLQIPKSLKIELLGSMRSDAALPDLKNELTDWKLDFLREATVRALGKIGSQKAMSFLLQVLADEDDRLFGLAAYWLGKYGSEEATNSLLKFLNHENTYFRQMAAHSLGEIIQENVISALCKALNDEEVSLYASLSLAKINSQIALPPSCRSLANKILLKYQNLQNTDSFTRNQHNQKIQESKQNCDESRELMLDEMLNKNLHHHELVHLAGRLINTCGDDIFSIFLKMLNHKKFAVRFAVARALAERKCKGSIPVLLEGMAFRDSYFHSTASIAIKRVGSPELISSLYKILLGIEEIRPFHLRHILDSVLAIQGRCKFYNYEIAKGILPKGKTISLYFSYVSADEALQTQLANHLTLLEHQGIITSWSSHQILPGDDRTQTIHQQLNTADIILLLISPDAIADDTCYHLEIQRAIERHQSGEARVIPILLRPVDWQGAPFSQLDMLPKNHQPVATWQNQDEAFREITEGVRTVAMELRKDLSKSNNMEKP